ncbi:DUF5666 domain-containing protein [Acidocella sp.]|uniref:DUF5666 domain-containing protein n=1 Tax=Acidocella sp. TaxID=50710 RepID=UPI00262269CD|nr:DUF5666 domain-containing protein [Acidocella sp.]
MISPDVLRRCPTGPRRSRALLAAVAAAALLLAAGGARAQETGGIGGTGIGQETGGIGGTGMGQETGGIGGTGIGQEAGGIGGTGIRAPITGYGPIQRFGSVFVNGREYRVGAGTLVTIDGKPAPLAALRVGDLVLVHGVAEGAHGGAARSITAWQAIIGPVGAVSANGTRITVLGQTVALGAAPPAVRVGAMVGISGQPRADGTWTAYRVTLLPPAQNFRLAAVVSAVGKTSITFGGLTLQASPAQLAGIRVGEPAVITGQITNGQPVLTALSANPLNFGPPGTRVEIEGYFQSAGSGKLVGSNGIVAQSMGKIPPLSGERPMELVGQVSASGEIAGTIEAEAMPDLPGQAEASGGGDATPGAHNATAQDQGGATHGTHNVEPPEASEATEPEAPETEAPEIELPDPQTPEPDIDAPEVEPASSP